VAPTSAGISAGTGTAPVEERITGAIAGLGDWRGEVLGTVRAVIREAAPDVVEDLKWAKASNPLGVPTWSRNGILCTGEIYRAKVKLTFMKGAALDDPSGLYNASLSAGTRRAIDFHEGDPVPEEALADLVRAAAALGDPSP
jgi:hypothetical protein